MFSIDNGDRVDVNIATGEYSPDWQENVLRNASIKKHRLYVSEPGMHTLNLMCKTQGMVIQKIVHDTGGLKESYVGPRSTMVN